MTDDSQAADAKAGVAKEEKDTLKRYTEEDVKKHNKEDDIWFIIHGKVYDVTKYIDDHPGGREIMNENAGKNVTEQFEEFFHSKDARVILKKHEIGALEGSTEEDWKKLENGSSTESTGSGFPSFLLPLLIVLVAVLYQLQRTYNFI